MTRPHPIERDDVMAFLDGELPPDGAERVRRHLDACDACRALATDLRQVSVRLQDWEVGAPADGAMPAAVRRALDAGASAPASWRAWLPSFDGWAGWSLAAASVAGIVLVVAIARPGRLDEPAPAATSAVADARQAPAAEGGPAPAPAPATAPGEPTGERRLAGRAASAQAAARAADNAAKPEQPPPPAPIGATAGGIDLPGRRAVLPGAPAPSTAATGNAAAAAPPAPSRPVGMADATLGGRGGGAGRGGFAGQERLAREEAGPVVVPLRTVDVTLTAADVAATRRDVTAIAARAGGVVRPVDAPVPDPPPVRLDVPVDRVEAVLAELAGLGGVGVEVTRDRTEDVSAADAAAAGAAAIDARRQVVRLDIRIIPR